MLVVHIVGTEATHIPVTPMSLLERTQVQDMQNFEVRGERDGARVRVHATGELDVASAPLLRKGVHERLQGPTEALVLDLRDVGFIDSTGVRLLLALAAQGERDGWTLAILPSDPVLRVIALLSLQDRLLSPQLRTVEPPSRRVAA